MTKLLKRKILILTPGFPEGENDTACMPFLKGLARAHQLNPERADIKIISFQYPFHSKPYRFLAWEVVPFGGQNKKGLTRIVLWMRILFYMLRQPRPDAVICLWATETSLIGNIFRGIKGVHCITWMPGQDVLPSNKYLRILNIDPTRYFPISEMSAKTIKKTISSDNEFDFISMGVDESIHRKLTRHKDPDIEILGAGSLSKLKQWNIFLDVCKDVKASYPDLDVLLMGDGPEKQHLMKQAVMNGFEDNIFTGEVSNEEVIEKMYHSKILLHTSSFEGQSAVITNALRAGMHVVCFDVGRIHIEGRVHLCRDEKQMTDTILHLLRNSQTEFTTQKIITADETLDRLIGICEA